MADNTVQTGTDTIATDDVTTLNGSASSGIKVQRTKTTYGDDGVSRDVSTTYPLPVTEPDVAATGTITATDAVLGTHGGVGTVLTGTPTANSYVAMPVPAGASGFTLRLSGTFGGGTVWMESSVDSTNGVDGGWTTNILRQSGVDTTTLDTSLTAAGMFRGVAAGYSYLRLRITGATTPSVTVALRCSTGPSVTAQVASLPPGSNSIGTVDVRGASITGTSGAIAAAGTGTVGPLDVSRAGNVTFIAKNTVAASAWAGAPVLVFEQSDDSTSWAPLPVVRNDNMQAGTTFTLAANAASTEMQFDASAESMNYVRVRVTTGPTTNGMTIVIGTGGMAFTPVLNAVQNPIVGLTAGTGTHTVFAARSTATTAATAVLQAAPAAGLSLYVTDVSASNSGAALSVVSFLPTSGTSFIDIAAAATGGGGSMNFRTPVKLAAATGLSFTTSVASTTVYVTATGYTAP